MAAGPDVHLAGRREVIAEDFSSSPIDTPEAMKGFKFYRELIDSGVVPSQQTIRDRGFDQMFRDGQVAMFMGGAADSLDTRVENFMCCPRGSGRPERNESHLC